MGVTSVMHQGGNWHIINVVAVKSLAKVVANLVACDSASVSWFVFLCWECLWVWSQAVHQLALEVRFHILHNISCIAWSFSIYLLLDTWVETRQKNPTAVLLANVIQGHSRLLSQMSGVPVDWHPCITRQKVKFLEYRIGEDTAKCHTHFLQVYEI